MLPAFSFVLRSGKFLYPSVKVFLNCLVKVFLASRVFKLSSLISLRSKSLTTNLVGRTWFWLMTLIKVLTPVRLMYFFLLMLLLTALGFLAIPTTVKWGNLCFWDYIIYYFSSFFIVFSNDCFFASKSSWCKDDDSAWFETKIKESFTFLP